MRRDGESPRALLVGCGNIAEFHVKALREAGFDVPTVASRRICRLKDCTRH
jgi:glutamyl-tRNA reductase